MKKRDALYALRNLDSNIKIIEIHSNNYLETQFRETSTKVNKKSTR